MELSYYAILEFIAILSLSTISSAANGVPSFGLQTALQLRFEEGAVNRQPSFVTHSANLANLPVLTGQDVRSALTDVFVKVGTAFLRHSHPRSSDVIYVLNGVFRVLIAFEGTDARVVKVDGKAGEAMVFPQGVIHEVKCVSKKECLCGSVHVSGSWICFSCWR